VVAADFVPYPDDARRADAIEVVIGQGAKFAMGCNLDTYSRNRKNYSAVEDYERWVPPPASDNVRFWPILASCVYCDNPFSPRQLLVA
jgi:hypothetical protein